MKYDRHDKCKKPYGVKWTIDGKRRFKFFAKKLDQDTFYRGKLAELNKGMTALSLNNHEATIMLRCLELLNGNADDVLLACKQYIENNQLTSCPAVKAIKEYTQEKTKIGRNKDYQNTIKVVLERLEKYFPENLADWTSDTARSWSLSLTEEFSPRTIKNNIKVARAFCNWAVSRNFIKNNIFADVPLPDIILPEPEYLSLAAINKIMETAQNKYPDAVAYFALGAFAGLRSSAAVRLELSAFDFDNKGILIQATQAKNKRRAYLDGFENNLWLWLEWARNHAPDGFALPKRRWYHLRDSVVEKAEVTIPHNGLRHSFCTYHVALHGNAGRTATLLTHRGNVSILYDYYKGNVSRAEAEKYFSIVPK